MGLRSWRRAGTPIAALAALLALTACGGGSDDNASDQSGKETLRMGVAIGPPYMFKTATGEWTSYWAELAEDLERVEGVEIEFVETTWPTMVAGLQADKYDFTQPISGTPERAEAVDFSESVVEIGTLFFVSADSDFRTVEDLNKEGVKIATISGSAEETFAKNNAPNATLRALPTASVADLATEVTSGRSDAFVNSSYFAQAVVPEFNMRAIPDYESNPGGMDSVPTQFAVQKGDQELADRLNGFIQKEREAGRFQELDKKWLTLENLLKG